MLLQYKIMLGKKKKKHKKTPQTDSLETKIALPTDKNMQVLSHQHNLAYGLNFALLTNLINSTQFFFSRSNIFIF